MGLTSVFNNLAPGLAKHMPARNKKKRFSNLEPVEKAVRTR